MGSRLSLTIRSGRRSTNDTSRSVDVVVHSATKYLAGHADLMGGMIVASEPLIQAARWQVTKVFGGVISPDVAWLVLRGLKTLVLRMEGHNRNAQVWLPFSKRIPRCERCTTRGFSATRSTSWRSVK